MFPARFPCVAMIQPPSARNVPNHPPQRRSAAALLSGGGAGPWGRELEDGVEKTATLSERRNKKSVHRNVPASREKLLNRVNRGGMS